jgi:hypothetical protein
MRPNQDNTNQMINKSFQNRNPKSQKPQMNLLNGELVSLINGLIESIKEYYHVSLSNNSDAKNIFLFYEETDKNIQMLLNDIINNNQYQKLTELLDKINLINKIIFQLRDNSDSCLQNLRLFFDDAKLIFQCIRGERQKQLLEKKSRIANLNGQNNTPFNPNLITQITNLHKQLLKSVQKFSDYDYIIETTGDNSIINDYQNLQNNIKKDLNTLFNLIQYLENINNRISLNSFLTDESNNKSSKSLGKNIENEIEKLKKMNIVKDNKIRQLMLQINNLAINKTERSNPNNNYNILKTEGNENSRIKKLEQIILDKDNKLQSLINQINMKKIGNDLNNGNMQNLLEEKDKEIFNLKQQLNIYEQNEQNFNKQIDNLTNQFQNKRLQYEKEIFTLRYNMAKNINDSQGNININKTIGSKSENNQNLKFLKNPDNINNDYIAQITSLNNTNMNLTAIIKKQKTIIAGLQKEISNYKAKLAQYEKLNKNQIEQMNNNIYKNNKIIEQKDELIKQLREKKDIPNSQININMSNQANNNELIHLKIENEKLKEEINLLKLSPSNNLINNNNDNMNLLYNNNFQELQQLNIKLMEENNSLKLKVANIEKNPNLLTTNGEFNNLYEQQKETIERLESEVNKKKEEIGGLQDFIAKLQSKLENSNFYLPVPKAHSTSKIQRNAQGAKNNMNDDYTKTLKKLIDLNNKANKEIEILKNKNKELQYKLEEKQVEEELSGFKTEDVNFSNYEEEFDLRKMINGAKDKNKSEDINIDYPGMQGVKDKNKELQQRVNMLSEQVKILISNININNKIKPQISQLCQLMKIPPKNIQLIIAGKNKKQNLGIID